MHDGPHVGECKRDRPSDVLFAFFVSGVVLGLKPRIVERRPLLLGAHPDLPLPHASFDRAQQ